MKPWAGIDATTTNVILVVFLGQRKGGAIFLFNNLGVDLFSVQEVHNIHDHETVVVSWASIKAV